MRQNHAADTLVKQTLIVCLLAAILLVLLAILAVLVFGADGLADGIASGFTVVVAASAGIAILIFVAVLMARVFGGLLEDCLLVARDPIGVLKSVLVFAVGIYLWPVAFVADYVREFKSCRTFSGRSEAGFRIALGICLTAGWFLGMPILIWWTFRDSGPGAVSSQ